MKSNDHYDFFLNARARKLNVVACPVGLVVHDRTCGKQDPVYNIHRNRWSDFFVHYKKKWNLRTLHDNLLNKDIVVKKQKDKCYIEHKWFKSNRIVVRDDLVHDTDC